MVILCWQIYGQHGSVCNNHGEGAWSFCISLCAVYLSFCAFGIKLCSSGYPTGLAMFASVKQACTNPCATVSSQRRNNYAVCSNLCAEAMIKARRKQLLAIPMANTGTSTVIGDTE